MDLKDIKNSKFLKTMSYDELNNLSTAIRRAIIKTVSEKGGHLSSNLGIVELTVAIHYVFDNDKDRILFDVGHQSYTHKILTGRYERFTNTLREFNGIAGFQKLDEGDCFEAGHASTSIAASLGFALANKLNNDKSETICVTGDAAMTSGLALEALDNVALTPGKVIIIVNDNGMAIGKTPGTLLDFKHSNFFENIGIQYIGPFDGHNISELVNALEMAKQSEKSIVVHVKTIKGYGYDLAQKDKIGIWHGVPKFDIETGQFIKDTSSTCISWSQATADIVGKLMKNDKDIVAMTPAMTEGSKFYQLLENYPERTFDVGICEEFAVTFSAGLSLAKKKPYLAIYSSFMQRTYDQLNHDIARMNLGLVVGVDRSGIIGKDGSTHHGIYDVGMLKSIPNTIISMPKDYLDALSLYQTAFKINKLFFIRYPRDNVKINNDNVPDAQVGKWDYYPNKNAKLNVIITGPNFNVVKKQLEDSGIFVNLAFARFYNPLDMNVLEQILANGYPTIVYDIYATNTGLYDSITSISGQKTYKTGKIIDMCIPNEYITHGDNNSILKSMHRDIASFIQIVEENI